MIEEDVSSLEKRVDEIESRFSTLIIALSASFGNDFAEDLRSAQSRVAALETQLAQMRSLNNDRHQLIVELARILGVRGDKITTEALLRAAKRKAGK